MPEIFGEVGSRLDAFLELMDELEYRPIHTQEDLEQVGLLRSRSYRAYNIMQRSDPIIDELDRHSHAFVFALYYRERMISTIRLHHLVAEHRHGTSYDGFANVLDPLLDQGLTFVDSVRHASEPDMLGELPMPFLTMRLVAMACQHFEVDYTLASIKRAHFAFYRRNFGATQLADEHQYGGFAVPFGLFASSYAMMRDTVLGRYPFFRSLPRERELLFAPRDSFKVPPLTVRPTARQAIAQLRLSSAAA